MKKSVVNGKERREYYQKGYNNATKKGKQVKTTLDAVNPALIKICF